MVLKLTAYRSNAGNLYDSWEEAAAHDAVEYFIALNWNDGTVENRVAALSAAKALFVDNDERMMAALEGIATLLQQKDTNSKVIPIESNGRRWTFSQLLANADKTTAGQR